MAEGNIIQHFDGTILKITKEGEQVASSFLAEGERLLSDIIKDKHANRAETPATPAAEETAVTTTPEGTTVASNEAPASEEPAAPAQEEPAAPAAEEPAPVLTPAVPVGTPEPVVASEPEAPASDASAQ